MQLLKIDKIINKSTQQEVCQQYYNKPIKEFIATEGSDLKIIYEDGSFFTHEKVLYNEQDDYGFWFETTNKFWKLDWI